MQPSDDEEDSSTGGVICRCDIVSRCGGRGVQSRKRGDGDVDEDRRLEWLLERRMLAMKEVVKEVDGVPGLDVGCRLTNEESMLYAGVEGSNALSVSLGGSKGVDNEGIVSKLVVDDDADFHCGVWYIEGCDRTPIVEGSTMSSES
jgi:hypothetical protein